MSNPVPSSLALAVINTNDPITSAPHRNNYSAIQAAVNGLIADVGGGTANQVLTAVDASDVLYKLLTDANIDPAAAIAYSKLNIGNAAIVLAKLAAGTNHSLLLSGASTVGSLATGTATQLLQSGGASADPAWATLGAVAAAAQATPADPAGNAGAAVMMGLSAAATILTPNSSRVFVEVTGDCDEPVGAAGLIHLRYGTGNGPANGAAVAGTVVGNSGGRLVSQTSPTPFALTAIITGLAPSPGATTATGVNALNSATMNVGSTASFPAAGSFVMGGVSTAYTGKTATTLTGCGNHAATTGGEVITSGTGLWFDLDLSGDGVHTAFVHNITINAFDLI